MTISDSCKPVASLALADDTPATPRRPVSKTQQLTTTAGALQVPAPQYVAARSDVALDKTSDCTGAFQIAPIDGGKFTMKVVPGSYVIRTFYTSGDAIVDVAGETVVKAGDIKEITIQ